jgi:hypothetical protein
MFPEASLTSRQSVVYRDFQADIEYSFFGNFDREIAGAILFAYVAVPCFVQAGNGFRQAS